MIRILSTMKLHKEDNKPVQIIENLFIGSFAAAGNKEALQANNITHIVVAASGHQQKFPDNFKYMTLTILDSPEEDIKKYFDETGVFIDECIKSNGSALVHCHAGISRSSSVILAYMIKYKKMKFEDALALAKSKREKINPNQG